MENTMNLNQGMNRRRGLDRTDYYAKQWRNNEGYKDSTAFRAERELEQWLRNKRRTEGKFIEYAD